MVIFFLCLCRLPLRLFLGALVLVQGVVRDSSFLVFLWGCAFVRLSDSFLSAKLGNVAKKKGGGGERREKVRRVELMWQLVWLWLQELFLFQVGSSGVCCAGWLVGWCSVM